MDKAANYYRIMGYGSFAPGNAEGGLTTLEEKSMGAYSKSGSSPISGLIKPGDVPPRGGLYLLDVVPDGEPRFGFPNISDNAEIVELIACGSHLILFTTGRGSVVGSAISPVIKVCANPDTYDRMADDMDVNAGRILRGAELDDVGREIYSIGGKRRERRAVQVRGARPPGIHPDLQTIRTDRSGLPAGRVNSGRQSLETRTFWLRGRGAPRSRARGWQHCRPVGRRSGSRGRRPVTRLAEETRGTRYGQTTQGFRGRPAWLLRGRRRQVHRHRAQLRGSRRRNRREDSRRTHRVHESHELHRRPQRHRAEAARLDQDGLGSRARRRHRQRHALRERGRRAETHRGLLRDQ